MSYTTITLNIDSRGVAYLRLDRAEKHNAMSALMIEEITDATSELEQNSTVRVVVLEAAGKTFCAGGDLEWMKEQMYASREQRITEARKLADMLNKLNSLSKPLIGKIQGNAFGGGVGMMSVCDLAICSKNIKIALTEVKLGLIPATISPYVVARIGETNARKVGLSAKVFDAIQAREFGLVAEIAEDLDAAIEAEISWFLKVAPDAVAATKALFRHLGSNIDEAVINHSIERLADTWEGREAQEGISAFFEKRNPKWLS